MQADYAGLGIDQLAAAIETIKTRPESRRIIVTAWNPLDLKQMALPPCHLLMQFLVLDGELSCVLYQRSCDVGLGIPFNIASYALLTRMIAQACGLKPGEFIHMLGDAHIYLSHVDSLKEQLKRKPYPFPRLRINPDKMSIDNFVMDDFQLENYQHHKAIRMEMAV
jgi:thymidylate synthase